jgi:branched-chain amino acid transport system ATP-binding protein
MSALRAESVSKAFGGVHAVREVSLRVEAGQIVALIGPNGAGKSTFFNILTGQLTPDDGHISIEGRDVTGLPPRRIWRLGVARTFQIAASFGSMTARQAVQLAFMSDGLRFLDPFRSAARLFGPEADALLDSVGIAHLGHRVCATLAYGDVKRVEVAVALANQPRVLLMDEPTAGMAQRERGELMAMVAEIVRERRMALLFTEHDMEAVFQHADRIMVLHRGGVVAEGEPDEVRHDRHVQAIYLGSGALGHRGVAG